MDQPFGSINHGRGGMAEQTRFEAARRSMSFAFERGTSLADPFLAMLPIDGASVSVLRGPVGQWTVNASDTTAEWLDELQFGLGEGPCWDAMDLNSPISVPNLQSGTDTRWPAFTEAITEEGNVAAIHAFPLVFGSLDIGAVDLYSSTPGALSAADLANGSALASIATWQVLRTMLANEHSDSSAAPAHRRVVHQATGMVLVQLDVTAEHAELIVRAHAFASGRSVIEVATDIVDRRLNLSTAGREPDDDPKLSQ